MERTNYLLTFITGGGGFDVYEGTDDYLVYYGENVPLFRRNGYRKSGAMIP